MQMTAEDEKKHKANSTSFIMFGSNADDERAMDEVKQSRAGSARKVLIREPIGAHLQLLQLYKYLQIPLVYLMPTYESTNLY